MEAIQRTLYGIRRRERRTNGAVSRGKWNASDFSLNMDKLSILTSLAIAATSCAPTHGEQLISKNPAIESPAPRRPVLPDARETGSPPWGVNENLDAMRISAIARVLRENILLKTIICEEIYQRNWDSTFCDKQLWKRQYDAILIEYNIPQEFREKIIEWAFEGVGEP